MEMKRRIENGISRIKNQVSEDLLKRLFDSW